MDPKTSREVGLRDFRTIPTVELLRQSSNIRQPKLAVAQFLHDNTMINRPAVV
jgi:hypothetical protein